MPSILILEDEEVTALTLEVFCQRLGYTVFESVNDYDSALQALGKHHPDLLLCDIVLEGSKNGLEVAQYAQDHYGIPSVLLTAYYNDAILSQAKHLDFHGYILKPYKEKELEATLRLVFHKIAKNRPYPQRYFEMPHRIFDMKTQKLFDDEAEIHLSQKSRRLIYYLLLYFGETREYNDIIDYVYHGDDVSLDTLRQLVRRTRKAFEHDPIRAVRNVGYTFVLER